MKDNTEQSSQLSRAPANLLMTKSHIARTRSGAKTALAPPRHKQTAYGGWPTAGTKTAANEAATVATAPRLQQKRDFNPEEENGKICWTGLDRAKHILRKNRQRYRRPESSPQPSNQ